MAKVKPSFKGESELISKLSGLKLRLGHAENLVNYTNSEGWEHAKALILDLAKSNSNQAEKIARYRGDLSSEDYKADIIKHYSIATFAESLVSIIDEPKKAIEYLKKGIESVEVSLQEKRKEMSEFGINE